VTFDTLNTHPPGSSSLLLLSQIRVRGRAWRAPVALLGTDDVSPALADPLAALEATEPDRVLVFRIPLAVCVCVCVCLCLCVSVSVPRTFSHHPCHSSDRQAARSAQKFCAKSL
jgi:hypothetical protein